MEKFFHFKIFTERMSSDKCSFSLIDIPEFIDTFNKHLQRCGVIKEKHSQRYSAIEGKHSQCSCNKCIIIDHLEDPIKIKIYLT